MSDNQSLDAGRDVFLEEAAELLEQLEESLLELEESPDDIELVSSVFRALHTIKGSGAMFGFDRVSAFTHEVETVFDKVRSGDMAASPELIDLTLASRDIIRGMLEEVNEGSDEVPEENAQNIVRSLQELSGSEKGGVHSSSSGSSAAPGEDADVKEQILSTWRIRYKPPLDVFASGTNPCHLLEDLMELGETNIVALNEDVPPLSELNPEQFHIGWDVLLTTDKGKEAIEDVFIFVDEESDLIIELVEHHDNLDDEDADIQFKRLGEILVMRGELTEEQLNEALGTQKQIGEILVDKGLISEDKLHSALQEQEHLKKVTSKVQSKQKASSESSIRVPSSKLDQLVNLVGELVTVQARLTQEAETRKDPQLLFLAEEVERLSAELRDNTMNIRMVPIGSTFSKFRRVVRDLSRELGRQVVMTTAGAETELDKTVIEKLNDPMVHLIRNSLDHGVEPPDVREKKGKDPGGTIHLEAEHSGSHVLIRVTDDGAGIDKEKIRKKAVERGLLEQDAEISDKELYGFIFSPGFSTATVVSSVSGRGVGMDVVRTNIEELRGSIDVKSSVGQGTTVTLKIPLTLAIIEGLLARVGDERYVLPLAAVEECVELEEEDAGAERGRNLVNLRGELVPYVHLRRYFDIGGDRSETEQIVVTRMDGHRVGFVVDEVIGQHQTVIKNLGYLYRDIKEISGATILGDGSLALILDVSNLVQETGSNRPERIERVH